MNMAEHIDCMLHTLQQQSVQKTASLASGEVVQDAKHYVAAEKAAARSKQGQRKSTDQLAESGDHCRLTSGRSLHVVCHCLHAAE